MHRSQLIGKIVSRADFFLGNCKARFLGLRIGKGTKISFRCRIDCSEGGKIRIGRNCVLHPGSSLIPTRDGFIRMGNDCSLNPSSILYGHGGLTIGDHVRIAAHVIIIPANHSFHRSDILIRSQPLSRKGIVIGNDVWIGAGAVILDGVEITSGCVVAAGAVVSRALRRAGIYGGVPARLIAERCRREETLCS